MTHLSEIHPTELTEADLILLDRIAQLDYHDPTLKGLLELIVSGKITVWRIMGSEAQGLVGTSIKEWPAGRELWLNFLVGEGFLKAAREIHQALIDLANRAECRFISGDALRPGLAKLYKEVLGVRPRSQLFVEELSHGN
jgi:hypothetical protein